MTATNPRPPAGLQVAGRALWRDLTTDPRFELDAHELALAGEIARTADLLDELAAAVRRDGPVVTVDTKHGKQQRTHPAAVEARSQRITLARLITSLRLPDETGQRPQRRQTRGVYGTSLRAVRG